MAESKNLKPVLVFGGEIPDVETVNNFDETCEGKVIKWDGLVLQEMIEKAKVLGAKGVVAYGINYRDYRELLKSGDEFPVAILGGFGVKNIDT